jgi:hypothetical protein
LLSDHDRRRLGRTHASNTHPAAGIFRWLAADSREATACADTNSQEYNFEAGECYKCPVLSNETFCAKVFDVALDVSSVTDAIMPIVLEFVDPDEEDGYLDKIIKPFTPLDDAIPGLSDLTGSEVSVLTFAKIYDSSSGAETVEKVLAMYDALVDFVGGLGDGDIDIATECDFSDFPDSCIGGLFDETRRHLSEDGRLVSRRLILDISDCGDDCDKGKCLAPRDNTGKATYMKCKASGIEGLSFPFIQDPTSVLALLSGGDLVSSLFVSNELFQILRHRLLHLTLLF